MSTAEPQGHPALVESDQHRGSPVFDPAGMLIGTIQRVFVEPSSQRVVYADVTFGGFLGFGASHYVMDWDKLRADVRLRGFCAEAKEVEEIERAHRPGVSRRRLLHGRW